MPSLMIDNPKSKDRDDALRVRRNADGGWEAVVHISCVADAVPLGSAADVAAARRGRTVYAASHYTPMLGADSERAATLTQSAARSALTITMQFTADGHRTASKISRSTLAAGECVPISHQQVVSILDSPTHDLHAEVTDAVALSQALTAARRAAGAFVVYDALRGVVTTEDGRVIAVPAGQTATAYILVQELMVAANIAVAEWAIECDLPILFRNHRRSRVAAPVDQRDDEVAALLSGTLGADEVALLQSRINLTVQRAVYETTVDGHFGLQVPAYCHATSPLRRYADLVNQRIVLAAIDGESSPYGADALDALAQSLTMLDKKADDFVSDRYKQKARAQAAAAITNSDLSVLDDKAFTRVLKVALPQDAPPQAVADELSRRAGEGRLTPGHLALVLSAEGQGWQTVRAQVLSAARVALPSASVSLLSAWQQIGGGQVRPPEFDEVVSGPDHERSFAVRARFDDAITGWSVANAKKSAEQLAVWELVEIIGGHRANGDPTQTPPDAGATDSSDSAVAATRTPATVDSGSAVQEVLGSGAQREKRFRAALSNPVAWLNSFAVNVGAEAPVIEQEASGPPHARLFTVSIQAGPAHGVGSASTLRQAKVRAAEQAVTALFGDKG